MRARRDLRRRVERGRPVRSRLLHKLGQLSAGPGASTVAALVSVAFLLGALIAPRATPWLTAFEALAASVTLVMVFALQHTQSRQQAAVQRKLETDQNRGRSTVRAPGGAVAPPGADLRVRGGVALVGVPEHGLGVGVPEAAAYPNPTAVGRLLVKKRSISRCSPVNLKSWGEGGGDDLVTVDVGERNPVSHTEVSWQMRTTSVGGGLPASSVLGAKL